MAGTTPTQRQINDRKIAENIVSLLDQLNPILENAFRYGLTVNIHGDEVEIHMRGEAINMTKYFCEVSRTTQII